jgi:hypothetical protein
MQHTHFVRSKKIIPLKPFANFDRLEAGSSQCELLELTFNSGSHQAAEGDLKRRKYKEQEVDDFLASFMDTDH